MMKISRFMFNVIVLLLFFTLPSMAGEPPSRGMFVTVIQDPPVLYSRENIDKLITYAKEARVKILFVQVYRANMAWFKSGFGDTTPYRIALKNVGEDPFALLIRKAHQAGIEVHAWVNMLSLGENHKAPFIKKYGPGILTRNRQPKKNLEEYKIDKQYFLEPGDPRVRDELVKLVEEIVGAYPELDGIQFDYIRYPDTKPNYGHSEINVARFRKATGLVGFSDKNKAWQDWKRRQVTYLLGQLVKKARSLRPDIQVSATGCMPYLRAYYEAYQDWPSWVNDGTVDFVTLMNYSTDVKEYDRWIVNAKARVKDFSKINIGLGSYKSSGSRDTFAKEYRICEKSGAGSCVVFHYGSLLKDPLCSDYLLSSNK